MVIWGDYAVHNIYGGPITVTMTYGSMFSSTEIEEQYTVNDYDSVVFPPSYESGSEDLDLKAVLIESDDGAHYYDDSLLTVQILSKVNLRVESDGPGKFLVW